MEKRRTAELAGGFLVGFLCAASLFCGCSQKKTARNLDTLPFQKQPYTLKISTPSAESSPLVQGLKLWAEAVKTRTAGEVEIQIYTLGKLGADEDIIAQVTQSIDVVTLTAEGVTQTEQAMNVGIVTDAGRLSAYVKDIGVINMPYFAANYEELQAVTETETAAEWTRQLDNAGFHIIAGNWYDGPRNFYTTTPVTKPADLAGKRIRTPGASVWTSSVAAFGAIPVALDWNDSCKALQSGSIDGVEVQTTSAFPVKIWEYTQYMTKTEHFQMANFIMTGSKWWYSVPERLREIIEEECRKQGEANARLVLSAAADWEQEMAECGLQIIIPDKAPFIQAAQSVYDELGFMSLRDSLWAEIGKR